MSMRQERVDPSFDDHAKDKTLNGFVKRSDTGNEYTHLVPSVRCNRHIEKAYLLGEADARFGSFRWSLGGDELSLVSTA